MSAARTVGDLVRAMESIAPTRLAESWDNVGLLAGDVGARLERVLVAVDYTRAVADEARALRCEAVVAYHPPLFRPVKTLTAESLVFAAVRDGIALYSPHTAYDVAKGGTNDLLADALGMTEAQRGPLRASPAASLRAGEGERAGEVGIGRVGALEPGVERAVLIERVKAALGVRVLLCAGPREGVVRRAAVCAGAGGDLLNDALAAGAELYLTGELRHHDALAAERAGCTVLCALHSNSERAAVRALGARIERALPGLSVRASERDRDPFEVV